MAAGREERRILRIIAGPSSPREGFISGDGHPGDGALADLSDDGAAGLQAQPAVADAFAVEAYRAYLREMPDAPNRADIESRLRALGAFFERYDILLSPTIARSSLPLGVVRMNGGLEQFQQVMAPMVAFTSVCNAAGVPAMSVPLAWTDDGLPIGLQFMGRFGAEEMLFSLAAELERTRPWRDRRPARGGLA